MNVHVIGFGRFACVVAQCLAERGHGVGQADETPHLNAGYANDEPGTAPYAPMSGWLVPNVVWIAYDVPLDAEGGPDLDEILPRIARWHARYPLDVPFLISCQWPAGTTAAVAQACEGRAFAYVVENVRVGRAIADFRAGKTMIVGTHDERVLGLLPSLFDHAVTMSPASAEMAKHALNAFLALQIAFINEIDRLGRVVGADGQAVSGALRLDARVSPTAPLTPGGPFGGGHLKRDLLVLNGLSAAANVSTPILSAILRSNDDHRS